MVELTVVVEGAKAIAVVVELEILVVVEGAKAIAVVVELEILVVVEGAKAIAVVVVGAGAGKITILVAGDEAGVGKTPAVV